MLVVLKGTESWRWRMHCCTGDGIRMEKETKEAQKAWEQRQASETIEQRSRQSGEIDSARCMERVQKASQHSASNVSRGGAIREIGSL